MKDRLPGAPGQFKAVIADVELQKMQAGEEFVFTVKRDDQPIEEGTPYSKAAVLPDTLADAICPGVVDPTPADALAALHAKAAVTADWENVDNLRSNGWYRFHKANGIAIGDVVRNYAYMRVDAYSSSHLTQTLYLVHTQLNSVLRRTLNNSSWSEWEWENPPMSLGAEYRTTERFLGKPVYTKIVNCGQLPNASKTLIEHGAAASQIVRFSGQNMTNGTAIPDDYGSTGVHIEVRRNEICISAQKNYSDEYAYVQMWYTKD